MPDDYEMANGLNKFVNDANDDKDQDRVGNLAEFLAGTDPQSPNDFLQAKSVTRSGTDTVVTFATVPGKAYRIRHSPTLGPGTWRTIVTNVLATGPETQITHPSAALWGFY